MKRRKLKSKDVAVVFGTFAPMHIGHVDVVTKAKRQHEEVLIIVSGTNLETDRGTRAGLPLDRRFRYAREVFSDDELVLVDKLDEKDIPQMPNGWQPWIALLKETIGRNLENQDAHITFYTGEQDYIDKLRELYPQSDAKLIERSIVKISATQIRENPTKYWAKITKPFRRHFTKKILVVGAASGGKTTLVKDLARTYGAESSLEYARFYQDKYNVRDEELDVNDYIHLLTDQYAQTADVIDDGSHAGMVFADTNSSVTKVYIDYYLKDKISQKEFQTLEELYEVTYAREQWDLIFVVLPESDYVDDGFRDMSMANSKTRDWFTEHLLHLMENNRDKIVILGNQNDGRDFFDSNYHQAKKAIKERLHISV